MSTEEPFWSNLSCAYFAKGGEMLLKISHCSSPVDFYFWDGKGREFDINSSLSSSEIVWFWNFPPWPTMKLMFPGAVLDYHFHATVKHQSLTVAKLKLEPIILQLLSLLPQATWLPKRCFPTSGQIGYYLCCTRLPWKDRLLGSGCLFSFISMYSIFICLLLKQHIRTVESHQQVLNV